MSCERHCRIYSTTTGACFYEVGDFEGAERHQSTTYGPFASMDEAQSHMLSNHSNPGGASRDESGTESEPVASPNGRPVVNPSQRDSWF